MDAVREGRAPSVIRQKGAEGNLPVPVAEKIEILVVLSRDRDPAIREKALQTLSSWNGEEVQQVLANPATPLEVLEYGANHMAAGSAALAEALLGNSALPKDLTGKIYDALIASSEKSAAGEAAAPATAPPPTGPAEAAKDGKRETLLQKLGGMSPSEKIKTALTGNMEERLVLIRDSNKLVARAVLGSPKITDQEIENIASMKNVTEEVLRLVAMNRKFMKSYAVVRQLINNPRTPIDVGLTLLNRLNDRDMKGLMLNKNVAEVIRGMAAKLIKQKAEASKPKLPGKS